VKLIQFKRGIKESFKKIKKTSHQNGVKALPSFAYHWGWLRKMKARIEKASFS
jgi:hypothetical protein